MPMLKHRKATIGDALLYHKWANEKEVRSSSFQSGEISLEDHMKWFEKKISDPACIMLLFEGDDQMPAGQVRLQAEEEDSYVIGISVDAAHRGKGYASAMLLAASEYFFGLHPQGKIHAYIKQDNFASVRAFENAGYSNPVSLQVNGINSYRYTKTK